MIKLTYCDYGLYCDSGSFVENYSPLSTFSISHYRLNHAIFLNPMHISPLPPHVDKYSSVEKNFSSYLNVMADSDTEQSLSFWKIYIARG